MQTNHPGAPSALTGQMSIVRHPIVDAQRNVIAYELFNRSLSATGEPLPNHVLSTLNALAEGGAPFSTSQCDLFIPSEHPALEGPHWEFIDPATTVIEVPMVPDHVPEQIAEIATLLERLRAQGFRLSFGHNVIAPVYKPWQALADFVQVGLSAAIQPNLQALVAAIKARTGAAVVAHKIENAEQFELAKSFGVERFQGSLFSKPEVLQPRALSPGEMTAMKLFNMVRQEASLDAVELTLKKDAALGVSLLRIINSAAMGLKQPVTSLRQAAQLMGYQKLGRWSAMLMTFANQSSTSLLGASAVVRGRMMELLAQINLSDDEAGAAFLVGLLSQLDHMLGAPMETLLEGLDLEPEITAALLQRSGKFGDMLSLVVAIESEDDQAFSEVCARLKFSDRQINMAHMEALVWGDSGN